MKATGYVETCKCCHSTRRVITDYEMFEGSEGAVYYVFTNKTGERYCGARADIEFLIELMQMRLKWLKDDEEPTIPVGESPISMASSLCVGDAVTLNGKGVVHD